VGRGCDCSVERDLALDVSLDHLVLEAIRIVILADVEALGIVCFDLMLHTLEISGRFLFRVEQIMCKIANARPDETNESSPIVDHRVTALDDVPRIVPAMRILRVVVLDKNDIPSEVIRHRLDLSILFLHFCFPS